MKRKIIAILLVCMAVSSAAGCGTKGGVAADTETEILTEGTEAALSGSSLDRKYKYGGNAKRSGLYGHGRERK